MKRNIAFIIFILGNSFLFAQPEELSLSKAIELTLEKNYGIQISKSEVEIAQMNNTWKNTGKYPSVNFSLSSLNSYNILNETSSSRIIGSAGLSWNIFNGFKAKINKERYQELENLAKGRTDVVIESSIQDIILSYYNVLLQEEKLKVLGKVMDLSFDRYEYEQTKKEFGNSLSYNVLQAKNLFLNDKSIYLNQEVIYKDAIRKLNFLMNNDPLKEWKLTEDFRTDTTNYNHSILYDKMISNNNVLKNQYINGILQKKQTDLQKSNLYPSIQFNTGLDNSISLNNSNLNSVSPYANISLSYSFFTGGVKKRAIDIAKINESITGIETEEMIHGLKNQLYSSIEEYNVRKEILYVSNESLEAAEISLNISEEKYKSGAINSFNYRDIQVIYQNTAIKQLQAIYNLIYSETTLIRLTGGFLSDMK